MPIRINISMIPHIKRCAPVVFGVILFFIAHCTASEIRAVTEDFPPYSYMENGRITGLSTEMVREIAMLSNTTISVEMLPWPRAYRTALETPDTLIFSLAWNSDRAPLFHWVGCLAHTTMCFYAMRNQPIHIETLNEARKYIIGAPRDSEPLNFLKQNRFSKIEVSGAPDNLIRMLYANNRFDLMIGEHLAFPHRIRKMGYDMKRVKRFFVPRLSAKSRVLYLAFSKKTDIRLVNRFRRAYRRLCESGRRTMILKKYMINADNKEQHE